MCRKKELVKKEQNDLQKFNELITCNFIINKGEPHEN